MITLVEKIHLTQKTAQIFFQALLIRFKLKDSRVSRLLALHYCVVSDFVIDNMERRTTMSW